LNGRRSKEMVFNLRQNEKEKPLKTRKCQNIKKRQFTASSKVLEPSFNDSRLEMSWCEYTSDAGRR
jgi:hypothetical protein